MLAGGFARFSMRNLALDRSPTSAGSSTDRRRLVLAGRSGRLCVRARGVDWFPPSMHLVLAW